MTIFERIRNKASQALNVAKGVYNLVTPNTPARQLIQQVAPKAINMGVQGIQSTNRDIAGLGMGVAQMANRAVGNNNRVPNQLPVQNIAPNNQGRQQLSDILFGADQTIRTPMGSQEYLEKEYNVPKVAGLGLGLAMPILSVLPSGESKNAGQQVLKNANKTKNIASFDDLLRGETAKKVTQELDFLPQYADELMGEIDDIAKVTRNYDLTVKMGQNPPPKVDLEAILKQKRTELAQVNKQIKKIAGQKAPTNQATMIASDQGIIPLRKPLNSTQHFDDTMTTVKEVSEANRKTGQSIDEILQLPSGERLALPAGKKNVTLAQLRKLEGFNLDGKTFVAKNADEAREAMRLGLKNDQISIAGKASKEGDVLFDADGQLLEDLPANQNLFEFASEASKDVLNSGNRVTRWLRSMFLDRVDNLKRTFGPAYKNLEPTMEGLKTNIAEGDAWARSYTDRAADIVKNLGIKAGGEDDKLIRLIAKPGGLKKVIDRVGPEKAGKLEEAYKFLRGSYEEIFNFTNERRIAAGLNPLPYYGDDFLSKIGGSQRSMFDSFLEGSPKTVDARSAGIFKKQGKETTTGAFESFRDYMELAQRAAFTDLSGHEIRTAANTLSDMGGDKNAVDQLFKFSQDIIGDKEINPVLRTIEDITGKMAGVKVLGKASTLVSQSLSLPQAIGRDPIAFVSGNANSNTFKALRSKSRVLDVVAKTTRKELRTGNAWTKSVGLAGDVLVKGQDIANRLIFNGFISRAKKMGLPDDEAVKWADEQLVSIVGDRRLGMSPEAYSTFIGKIFGRFTIEPTAASTRLIKDIGEKKFGAVLGTLVAWHVGNKINEKYGSGFAPFLDPYEAVKDSVEYWNGSDEKEQSKLKAVTSLVSESLQMMPMIQNMFNTAYSLGEVAGALPDSDEVMGNDQTWMNAGNLYNPLSKWDRNITGNKAIDVPWNIGANVLPFLEQGARTTQAANTQRRGYAVTKDGSPMYDAPEGLDAGRSLLFGQSSTENARNFFDNDFSGWLSDKQKAAMDKLGSKEDKLNFLKTVRGQNESVNRIEGGAVKDILSGKPGTKAEADALRSYVQISLEGGVIPGENDIKNGLFNGYTATSKSIEERMDVYKEINSALNNEYYTDEQKQAIIKASGADPKNVEYYTLASKDQDVRLQELLPKLDNMDSQAMMEYLMTGRRAVGGKQLISNAMVDYLYDMDYLDKGQKDAIKALKYDEINDKFYYSKSYKGGGGSGISYAKAQKLFDIPLPKFSRLKSLDFLLSMEAGGVQTNQSNDRLLSSILSAPVQRNTNKDLWF